MKKNMSAEQLFSKSLQGFKKNSLREKFYESLADFFDQLKKFFFNRGTVAALNEAKSELEVEKAECLRMQELLSAANTRIIELQSDVSALNAQVQALTGNIDIENIPELEDKAIRFTRLSILLKDIFDKYEILNSVHEKIIIKATVSEMENELVHALDDFQKIKIYRRFLPKLYDVSMLKNFLEPFVIDKDKIKNKEALAELLNELREITNIDDCLASYFLSDHPALVALMDKARALI